MKLRVRLHVVENTTYNNFVVTMMDGEEWRTIKVVQIIELHLNLRTEKEKKKDKMFFLIKLFYSILDFLIHTSYLEHLQEKLGDVHVSYTVIGNMFGYFLKFMNYGKKYLCILNLKVLYCKATNPDIELFLFQLDVDTFFNYL